MLRNSEDYRVAMLAVPALLADIIRQAIAADGVLQIVGEYNDPDALAKTLPSLRANTVIIGPGKFAQTRARELLHTAPHLITATLISDGRTVVFNDLVLRDGVLPDVSPVHLIAAIRAALAARSVWQW